LTRSASGDETHGGEKGGSCGASKVAIARLVALSLIANGILAYALDTQNQSLSNLEDELSDLRAESSLLKSRTIALEEKPEAEAFDPAERKLSLDQLTQKVNRPSRRSIGAVTRDDLVEMAEAIESDRLADYDRFDLCIDDLLAVLNGDKPSGGLVC
jgi:hypothetical protein